MPDILEQFTHKPAVAEHDPRAYVAYKSVDRRQVRLKIRPALQAWERVPYSYLLRIVENSEYGTELGLVYTFMVVTVAGRNLQAIADAIETENCDFIQAFDPVRFDVPTDHAAPSY